jgi:hypothetical protein
MPIMGQWNVTFLLGIDKIDQHHKHLVEPLDLAYEDYKRGAPAGSSALPWRNWSTTPTIISVARSPRWLKRPTPNCGPTRESMRYFPEEPERCTPTAI